MNDRGVELRLAVVGVQTIAFLFHIGQLGVAEADVARVVQQGGGQAAVALDELLRGFRALAVAPAAALVPGDAAVLADEYRAAGVGLPVGESIPDQRGVGRVARAEDGRILLVIVGVEDIGLHVDATGGIDAGAGGVDGLGDAVGHAHGLVVLTVVQFAPGLVPRAPAHDGRRGVIAVNGLHPLVQKDGQRPCVLRINTPGGHFTPDDVAQLVGPVEEAGLEHLLVQACAVEAHGHGAQDVVLQFVIGGGGVNAVGIEALIKDQALEHRLAVDFAGVAVQHNAAQAEIGLHFIDGFAVQFQGDRQIVQIGLAHIPQVGVGQLQRQGDVPAVALRTAFALRIAFEGSGNAQFCAGGGTIDLGFDQHGGIGDVGRQANVHDAGGVGPLQPYRLPDAGGAGVRAAMGVVFCALLAAGLFAAAQVVIGADDDDVLAGHEGVGDFEIKGNIAAAVRAYGLSVDPYLA